MAKTTENEDLNEKVRRSLSTLVRNVVLVVAIVALGWVLYMLFIGADPRRDFETIDQTLVGYTEFVRPYVGQGAGRPSITALDDFLSFFDSNSRDFFRNNADALARMQYQFQQDQFSQLSSDEIKVTAMQNLINRDPLSGMGRIIAQHPVGDTDFRVTVLGRNGRRYEVPMTKQGGVWVMQYMGGLQSTIEQNIRNFTPTNTTTQ
jgi:hypothetical protein